MMKKTMLAVALSACGAANALTYAPYQARDVGSWPESVAVGDVTGDGRADVVLTTTRYSDPTNDYHVFVFAGQPGGTLALVPIGFPYGATGNSNGLALVDLDADGVKEIVIGHDTGLTIARHGGAGFTTQLVAGARATVLAVVDANVDGIPDIAALPWSGPVRIHHGDGDAGISHTTTFASVNAGYNDMEAADVNRDGHLDLVVMSGQGTGADVGVHLHDGAQGYLPATHVSLPGNELAGGLAVGDFNRDGRPDIALGGWGNSPVDVYVFSQASDGTFPAPEARPTYDIPESLLAHDADGNGLSDIALMHGGWNRTGVYLQSATGLGSEQLSNVPYASHYDAHSLAAGDFLGADGCPDLAIADYNHGLVTLQGQGCVNADLSVTRGLSSERGVSAFAVTNLSGVDAALEVTALVKFTSSTLAIVPPAECTLAPSTGFFTNFACELGDMPAATTRALVFRARGASAPWPKSEVTALSITRDANPGNNTFGEL